MNDLARLWKEELKRDRKDFQQFLTEDVLSRWNEYSLVRGEVQSSAVAAVSEYDLEYATEIGAVDPGDPMLHQFVDRIIKVCEHAIAIGEWEKWRNKVGLPGLEKGNLYRCYAHAKWLKTGVADLQLLLDAYTDLWKTLNELVTVPEHEWEDMKEAVHLSLLGLLAITGAEHAGLAPLPKRKKAREFPELYFAGIEGLRNAGAGDATAWKVFCQAFDAVRDPRLRTLADQLPMIRLEWGILYCRGTRPAPFFPEPKDVLKAIGR